ncbi:MAG: DMT family transporter [Chlamydiota bacterium]|jgi:drug/metabolite transporter (DMT)-like permease
MSVLVVIMMYGIWSSVFSIGKWTLEYAPPLFLTASRMILAGGLLLSFLLLFRRKALSLSFKQIVSLLVLAVFSIYLTNAFEFWGLQHLSAAKTCFIYSLSPFFAAFFSYLHFGEKMTGKKWIGLGIGFLGFLPVLATQSGSEDLFNAVSFLSWPELAIMGAALCSVYGWVLLRLLVKDHEVSPLTANGIGMLFGGGLALLHSYLVESWNPTPIAAGHFAPFMGGTLLMTFISNILCYNLYGMMLKKYTATFLSFVGLLSPIFASLNSWLVLGEKPSWIIFLSTSVVGLGLWLVYQAELKQGYIVQQEKEVQAN